ncbi:MAG: helix-turn-helix transcriptional regulator [Cytophagales bacterium]|nr:helix-turn-helix transcriptional regulator [Cytophagales bacterium]
MHKNYLGEFEELIMLTIGVLGDESYGVSIKDEMEAQTGKKPSIGALHTALQRLEKKGVVESWEGGATQSRGGRKKRFYRLTAAGRASLESAHEIRNQMFALMTKTS